MIFKLDPDVSAVVGPRATRDAEAAMQALTSAQLDGPAADAKLTLQRVLFRLEHTQAEGMQP